VAQPLAIIRRYAKALLDLATQNDSLARVKAEVETVQAWLQTTPDFRTFVACRHLGEKPARLAALRELAQRAAFSPTMTEFLAQCEGAQLLEHLPRILAEFARRQQAQARVMPAEIVSARPLTGAQREVLLARLGAGRRLAPVFREAPELRGGFIAYIGDEVHDYSVAGRLRRLRRRLTAG